MRDKRPMPKARKERGSEMARTIRPLIADRTYFIMSLKQLINGRSYEGYFREILIRPRSGALSGADGMGRSKQTRFLRGRSGRRRQDCLFRPGQPRDLGLLL